ncbi:MAG: histidine phosphatase family protein, partial [Planctomycetaceae bacterium]|nr:histidine phosphatase family protein [Planctomycetaceae bacterium]
MGRLLRDRGIIPDHVVASTARRARETAEHVAAACQIDQSITLTPDLYQADVDEWQTAIEQLSSDWNCVLCVGHNPELEELIGTLTSRFVRMPTASIAHLTCDVSVWQEFVRSDNVQIQNVWHPKEIK